MTKGMTRRLVNGGLGGLVAATAGSTASALEIPAKNADILIVGAGSAGCVLAARLSADPSRKVVLIDAGGSDNNPSILDPQLWPTLIGGPYDWGYQTQPQSGLNGRVLAYPRGKVLGGSSSTNALGHQRGHASIFDGWAMAGCAGWGYADLLPYFKAAETFEDGETALRGGSGPVTVIRASAERRSPLAESFVEAAVASGHRFNPDFNGRTMAGVTWNQFAIRNGMRDSEARAYLHPIETRPNLTVLTGAQVLELSMVGDRCTGVRLAIGGDVHVIEAAETILSAGAIGSPKLLMLSGIGPPEALGKVGVKARIAAPGVGRNLHDHPLCGVVYAPRAPVPASHYNHGEAVVFTHSGEDDAAPDIQIMMVDVPFTTPATGPAPAGGYSLAPCLMQPHSRGSVSLASRNPLAPPLIDPNYLSEQSDADRFSRAIELALDLGAAPALSKWRAGEALPGKAMTGPAGRAAYARNAVSPFFHPVGTCRMGSDAESVVDPALRVRGVSGLRIVDASVIPTIPNAMPNAAILSIAEKAAILIAQG